MTASIDALFACTRVAQKLIDRYGHIPTPSHPINNCNILSDKTGNIMKNVDNDRYEKNLILCGSSRIYSIEYIWARNDTIFITISITGDSGS
jgi:hypothetical protein